MYIKQVTINNNLIEDTLEITNKPVINQKEAQGIAISGDSNQVYFVLEHQYFVELNDFLSAIKDFLTPFSSGSPIGVSSQGPVTPDPALTTKATMLSTKIDTLITKLP